MSTRREPDTRSAANRLTDRFHADGAGSLSQERLLVLLYQRLLRDLQDSLTALDAGDGEATHNALVHAQEIISELDTALDHSTWDGAAGLSQLYGYLLDLLVAANLGKDPRPVQECISMLTPVADAWAGAWVEVSSPAARPASADLAEPAATAAGPDGQRPLDLMG